MQSTSSSSPSIFDWGFYATGGPSDVDLYFEYSTRIVVGHLPYRDFEIEYPPLALLFFLLPRLFADNPLAYARAFMLEMLFLDIIGLLVIVALAKRLGQSAWGVLMIYTLSLLAIGPIIAERYDLVPAILTLLALYAFAMHLDGLTWISLALGTLTKLYPLILAPLFVIAYLRRKDYRQIVQGGLIFVVTVVLVVLPCLLLSPKGFLRSFAYHTERGIQIESTYGSLLLIGHTVGFPVQTTFDHRSINLVSPHSLFLARFSPLVTVALLLLVYVVYFQNRFRSADAEVADTLNHALLTVLAVMIGGKVLSPQFVVWLYPLVPLLQRRWRKICRTLFVIIGALTFYIFPHHYEELMRGDVGAIDLLALRNALLVLMFYLLTERSETESRAIGGEPCCSPALPPARRVH